MNFTLIGTIKSITPITYGIALMVRETKIGGTSKNGHEIGTYDYTWKCIAQSEALRKYIQNYFRIGSIVMITGQVEQYIEKREEKPNSYNTSLKIQYIDLWNMGDPKKRRIRERYNSRVVGNDSPDTMDTFKNDF